MWSSVSPGMPANWFSVRRAVLRGSTVCSMCGQPGADEVDHIVPRSRGGSDDLTNLRPVHRACHASKSSREGVERRRALRANRVRPSGRHPGSL
jgi:5-methylcytosine-specific restriction protein A